ncbi:MAG: hypothetical protein HY706_21270 [Candidatus Hydrogenedentes bacterium]|nr:hypothetical protein [Candidatus Hydrogenedentota bacterium]
MIRILFTFGWCALAVAVALLILGVFTDPVRDQRVWLETELTNVAPPAITFDTAPDVDSTALQRTITGKANLWRGLVAPPKQAATAPNFGNEMAGVVITRDQIGTGDQVQVRVRVGNDTRGQWMGKGAVVKGWTIVEILPREVKFSKTQNGTEYTGVLPRGNR